MTAKADSTEEKRKATADELGDYRRLVLALVERVAETHREHGVVVSKQKQAAPKEISSSLGDSGGRWP